MGRVRCAVVGALIGALLGASGCIPQSRGAFASGGYKSAYGYDVPYQNNSNRMLPDGWRLDNYHLERGEWVQKHQAPYVTTYGLDSAGDGTTDYTFDRFTYALRYEHRVHAGVIWLRDIPISVTLRNKDLRVLMQDYIAAVAGATYETVRLGTNTLQITERRQAPVVIEQGPVTVAGQPAYAATIDVANLDEVRVSPDARSRRVQLVLMHAPQDDYSDKASGKAFVCPVIVLAGYSNLPADFQIGVGDFHDMLGRLTIAGASGLTFELAPERAPAPVPVASAVPRASTL